ncbi:MAG: sugar phosphate isomerase/epimerase [Ruminococcus sp.]|jgi:sugar phosphate isomerase/epimerase|nr:sugar phosphate isomerase/epimerase [Ruminococcus sp.]
MFGGAAAASLYPDLQEDCFFALASRGVKHIEIFLNTHSEFFPPVLSRIVEIKREFDIDITSVHPYTCGIEQMMLFTSYARRLDDFFEYQKLYFDYMNTLGARYFILHGSKPPEKLPEAEIFERFAMLQDLAESFGVTVLQENVVRNSSKDLAKLVRMKDYLGDKAQFVLDTKQARRSGYEPCDHVRALGKNIKHIHFSDADKRNDCKMFSPSAENDRFFAELDKNGYDGAVLLELYHENTPDFVQRLTANALMLDDYLIKKEWEK